MPKIARFPAVILFATAACTPLLASALDKEAEKRAICEQVSKSINVMIETGLFMKHSANWSDVQVSKDWYSFTFDDKGKLLQAVANCYAQGGVTKFRDLYSGETVAKAGPLVGFKVYK